MKTKPSYIIRNNKLPACSDDLQPTIPLLNGNLSPGLDGSQRVCHHLFRKQRSSSFSTQSETHWSESYSDTSPQDNTKDSYNTSSVTPQSSNSINQDNTDLITTDSFDKPRSYFQNNSKESCQKTSFIDAHRNILNNLGPKLTKSITSLVNCLSKFNLNFSHKIKQNDADTLSESDDSDEDQNVNHEDEPEDLTDEYRIDDIIELREQQRKEIEAMAVFAIIQFVLLIIVFLFAMLCRCGFLGIFPC